MSNSMDTYYLSKSRRKIGLGVLVSISIFTIFVLLGFFGPLNTDQSIFVYVLGLLLALIVFLSLTKDARRWTKVLKKAFPDSYKSILEKHVDFYRSLKEEDKRYFEQRILYFLHRKQITPVDCDIDDQIRIFIAASAIMPIFSFPDFFYRNIREILVYPDSFDRDYNFSTREDRKRIAGMVGNGVMSRMMILSKKDLLRAFDDRIDADNLAIHEFVHLIDMADGSVDGIPKALMEKQSVIPWVSEIHREMHRIKKRQSDIDAYSLTNNAEFLAVVSEYFFDTPDKFKERHPGLYSILAKIFKQKNG
jgi:Mlc titration factor MtfA (ptsG expression regulator)